MLLIPAAAVHRDNGLATGNGIIARMIDDECKVAYCVVCEAQPKLGRSLELGTAVGHATRAKTISENERDNRSTIGT